MVNTNAAVLPVPDCDWPIMFVGLWVVGLKHWRKTRDNEHTGPPEVRVGPSLGSLTVYRSPWQICLSRGRDFCDIEEGEVVNRCKDFYQSCNVQSQLLESLGTIQR